MTTGTPANMQGDLFSRGFPKYNESYYFFSILKDKETEFTQKLAVLVKDKEISTLEKVLADWVQVKARKPAIYPVSNALIAFSMTGLEKIQKGLPNDKLQLGVIKQSDPAFAEGMENDGPHLHDPERKDWDLLFQSKSIHGLLKVAGSSPDEVKTKLDRIKGILGYPTIIADIEAQSPPTSVNSRVDGQVRPKDKGLNGREHFDFEDGVSQPLLVGIDKDDVIKNNPFMKTPQGVITVGEKASPAGLNGGHMARPKWMLDGSFLVFRKLEQDVGKFKELTGKFKSAGCKSADQFGARLMGRWKSGAPIVDFPDHDPNSGHGSNEFTFAEPKGCPLAAHIRKTNPRVADEVNLHIRIVRNGIPYGTEFVGDKNGKRGLLFACYQSSIENGFQQIQTAWVNNDKFPRDDDNTAGYDPFIAQPGKDKQGNAIKLQTTLFDRNNKVITSGIGELPKLVKMKGGEYFFVPSIPALLGELGSA